MDIIGPIIGGFEMIMEMLQSGGVITYLILLLGVYHFYSEDTLSKKNQQN